MSEIKLLPCPFCQNEAYTDKIGKPLFSIKCKNVNCGCKISKSTFEEAVEAWNTRTPMNQIIEELRELSYLNFNDRVEDYNDYYELRLEDAIYMIMEVGGIE